jgi:hypothetical protein
MLQALENIACSCEIFHSADNCGTVMRDFSESPACIPTVVQKHAVLEFRGQSQFLNRCESVIGCRNCSLKRRGILPFKIADGGEWESSQCERGAKGRNRPSGAMMRMVGRSGGAGAAGRLESASLVFDAEPPRNSVSKAMKSPFTDSRDWLCEVTRYTPIQHCRR